MERQIRIGIDVGGTHTKAVAIDNRNYEIVGKSSVMTTHDDVQGVAAGVIASFRMCLEENNIDPQEVIFVAHSTTQATNALLEGDVARVGVLAISKGGLEGILAKKQSNIPNIDLGTGRMIKTSHEFLKEKQLNDDDVKAAIERLIGKKTEVIVASQAFGVDSSTGEKMVEQLAEPYKIPVTTASEITKLYGLTRRTRTAAINASILPKMVSTANSTEKSVRTEGITVPLMIMRGDGGVMDISEMKKRPVLTMLSGPAASIMGALIYLRASNGIYFEVGGTSTNIGVIRNGRPGVDYAVLGGHATYINSLDVHVLGVAGGSMVRANKSGVVDVGPRSAHIAGLPYSVYTPVEEIVNPRLETIQPKPDDPTDYICIRLENGKRVAITNSCAANVLGIVKPEDYSYGYVESARRAMAPLAEYMGCTIEEAAGQILNKSYEKIKPVIDMFVAKYSLDESQMTLVGVGGGAAALLPYSAKEMGLPYSIPENAEVISSIGVALAMVRDTVERIVPNPTKNDIQKIKQEATERAIISGADPSSIDVHIEIDPQTTKITAIATGSTEVRAMDLTNNCSMKEGKEIAAKDMGVSVDDISVEMCTKFFYAFSAANHQKTSKNPCRIIDTKGFIRVQRADGVFAECTVGEVTKVIEKLWKQCCKYSGDGVLPPDFYICMGGKLVDVSNMRSIKELMLVLESDLMLMDEDEKLLILCAMATV